MNNDQQSMNSLTPRENFLMSLLNKVVKEYKSLLEQVKKNKPYKIAEIVSISNVPGESIFRVQIAYKNCMLKLSAADLIKANYDLNEFSEFHAQMIRAALQGRLIDFLQLPEQMSRHKIVSKRFDRQSKQYIFTIEGSDGVLFDRRAEEISADKDLLNHLDIGGVYDVGYTQGAESILKESQDLRKLKEGLE